MAESELTVLIEKDLREKAEAVAAARGETLSDVVSSAFVEYVEGSVEQEYDPKEALRSDPLFSRRFIGGPGDVSERVEEILIDAADPLTGFKVGDDSIR
jgi:hypothetical protein